LYVTSNPSIDITLTPPQGLDASLPHLTTENLADIVAASGQSQPMFNVDSSLTTAAVGKYIPDSLQNLN
jgi:hypothetical protein